MSKNKRKKICIIGLGFVGAAMLIAISKKNGNNHDIVGIEKNNQKGLKIISDFNKGVFPISTNDTNLKKTCKNLFKMNYYRCTSNLNEVKNADIIIIDINLDIKKISTSNPEIKLNQYLNSFKKILNELNSSPLFIIQSTVPPGFTENYIKPLIINHLVKNRININEIKLCYSFERVMPGLNYLSSIVDNWRVIGSLNKKSANQSKLFFESFINTKKYPLTMLPSIVSAEMAKVMENSYRATNIAFVEEWSRLAEYLNIDIYKIINAIKIRPTHKNLAKPGFGVGGYCLTKDPLFGIVSNKLIYKKNFTFPISSKAITINKKMPLQTIKLMSSHTDTFKNKLVALFGISYKEDVGDIRFSPSIVFARRLKSLGSKVIGFDPLIKECDDFDFFYNNKLPDSKNIDFLVLAVPHKIFLNIKFHKYITSKKTCIVDSFNVLSLNQIRLLRKENIKIISIGKGNA